MILNGHFLILFPPHNPAVQIKIYRFCGSYSEYCEGDINELQGIHTMSYDE